MSLLGSSAPEIELFNDRRRPFKLSDHKGSPIVLLFFPAAFTGVCTTELNTVNNDLGSYTGALIVGISTDSPFSSAEFKKVNGLQFDLLSDHNAEACNAYGCKYDTGFAGTDLTRFSKRSAFVIDASGIVVYEEVLESAGDLPNLDAIKAKLAEIS